MLRSFAFTFTAVTLRAQIGIFQVFLNFQFTETYLIVPWLSWITNILITEWFIVPRTSGKKIE